MTEGAPGQPGVFCFCGGAAVAYRPQIATVYPANPPRPQVSSLGELPEPEPRAFEPRLQLALDIDAAVRRVRPDDWRGHQPRENEIKRALLPLLGNDVQEVERIFLIIKQHGEY
jgi:hypothetical protein